MEVVVRGAWVYQGLAGWFGPGRAGVAAWGSQLPVGQVGSGAVPGWAGSQGDLPVWDGCLG